MASLKESTTKFEELKVELMSSSESLAQRLEKCDAVFSQSKDPFAHFTELKKLEADIDEQFVKLENFKSLGENLLSTLDALDCRDTPKGKEIQSALKNTEASLHKLRDSVIISLQNKNCSSLPMLHQWAKQKCEDLEKAELISLDREILNKQIRLHRQLVSKIDRYYSEMCQMVSQNEGKPDHSKKSKDLQEQFKMLFDKAKQRKKSLEDIGKKLEAFHLNIYQLESWFTYVSHSVRQDSADLELLAGKVESLYFQSQEKEKHLVSLKILGHELLKDEKCGDKNHLEGLLQDVEQKWKQVEGELVQLTFTVAQRQMDHYSKYLEKLSKEHSESKLINADPEQVTKQYADQQLTHANIKKRHHSETECINKYKTIYRALTKQEPADIQSIWLGLQKQYTSIIKHSESHMAELQEALPAQLSADIEMDEILQEWIEVDSLDGKSEKAKSKATSEESHQTPDQKTHSEDKKTPRTPSPTSDRAREKSTASDVKDSTKVNSSKAEKKSSKKHDANASSIFDSDSNDSKKKKDAERKKSSSHGTDDSKRDKERQSSKKSSSSLKKVENGSEKWGPADIDLGRDTKGSRYKFFDYGIVILNCKDSVHMTEIRKFVNRVTKAGFIKFYRDGQRLVKVAVFLNREKDVNKCVLHLNNKVLDGRKVTVLKARIHREGLEYKRSDSSSVHHRKPILKARPVIRYNQLKKNKALEIAAKVKERSRPWFQPTPMKKILSLSDLRRTRLHSKTDFHKPRMHLMDIKQRAQFRWQHSSDRRDKFSPDIDLEIEKRKLMLEQQALERERLQAERERIALERERQRRQLEEMYSSGEHRRGYKRELEPRREDGSYWSEPKRHMYNQFPSFREEARLPPGSHGHRPSITRHPIRHSADSRHSFSEVRHMERNTFRSASISSPPDSVGPRPEFVPKLNLQSRPSTRMAFTPGTKTWPSALREETRKPGNRRNFSNFPGRHYKDSKHEHQTDYSVHNDKPAGAVRVMPQRAHLPYGTHMRKANTGGQWK